MGGEKPLRRRPAWLSALVALLVVLLAACGGAELTSSDGVSPGSEPTASASTSDTTTDEATPDPEDPGEELPTEAGPTPAEETTGPEPPVAGGEAGVSIELPGLPVGAGSTVDLGDAWCGVFFWGESPPPGVELQITAVVAETEGATVRDSPCEGAPPCPGTTISLESPQQGCGVTVVPPSLDAPIVVVRLDGVVHCEDAATCEGLSLSSGATAALENPNGGLPPVPDGGETGSPGIPGTDTDGTTADPGG